jgi:hypothetical protein
MAQARLPALSRSGWLRLARSKAVQRRIATDSFLEVYLVLIADAASRRGIGWNDAVALLHMVYAWMPTMLRTERVAALAQQDRVRVLALLGHAKGGRVLSASDLAHVAEFANGSVVGASKLLHVICPAIYPIWDSRVARAFLWRGVSEATFCQIPRYLQYQGALQAWSADPGVGRACTILRALSPTLSSVSDIRLMELVLFRSAK